VHYHYVHCWAISYKYFSESIEWFIGDQAFSPPNDVAPPPPPFPPLLPSVSSTADTQKEIQVPDGRGGRGWTKSYDGKKAWSSINHSILSGIFPGRGGEVSFYAAGKIDPEKFAINSRQFRGLCANPLYWSFRVAHDPALVNKNQCTAPTPPPFPPSPPRINTEILYYIFTNSN
jgi:hypothetical protein